MLGFIIGLVIGAVVVAGIAYRAKVKAAAVKVINFVKNVINKIKSLKKK